MSDILHVTHNAGIFSCYSIRLQNIVDFFNKNRCLPLRVDSSRQFLSYRRENEDLSKLLFQELDDVIPYINDVRISSSNDEPQFSNFDLINFDIINKFINKYFKPTTHIIDIIDGFINKYSINYDNTCAVLFRGNDKSKETTVPSYDIIFEKCKLIEKDNPDIIFLVQTDEREFSDEFIKIFTNSIRIEEIPMINKQNSVVHYQLPKNELSQFALNFLAVVIILSKCKYLVTNSGNCSYWTVLFRGNSKNVYQYLTAGRNIEYNPNLVEYNYWNK